MPVSKGGRDIWENVVSACFHCNSRKGNRTPQQASMPLLAVPYRPSWVEHLILSNRNILADQMAFLKSQLPKNTRLQRADNAGVGLNADLPNSAQMRRRARVDGHGEAPQHSAISVLASCDMPLTFGLTGMDPATESALKAAFTEANARGGNRWQLLPETEADFVVVDMDSMYGPMSWLRLHAAGKRVIGLTSVARTQTDFRLERPFDSASVAALLQQLDAGAPVAPLATPTPRRSADAAREPAAPEPPAPSRPA